MDMNIHYITSNQFTSYSDSSVTIKQQEYSQNILVTNDAVLKFIPTKIKELTLLDLMSALDFKPDLIIFGTGNKIIYPNSKLLDELKNKQIGIEVMPIQALCRTFNFLVSENRRVVCILLFLHNQ